MMMRQSQNVRTKGKRSFRDKQVSCTSSIKFEIFFFKNVMQFNNQCFVFCFSDRPTECTPEKKEAAQMKHLDTSFFIWSTIMYSTSL